MRWFETQISEFLDNPGQNNATRYGVSIIPAEVQPGQTYWRVIGVYHLRGSENGGKNNVYLDVLDEEGQRLGPPWPLIDWEWQGMRPHEKPGVVILDKPPSEPGGNIGLHAGQIATVRVAGRTSDKVAGLQTAGIDDPNEEPGNHRYHHSFYVVWQRVTAGDEPEPEEPPEEEEPTPGPVEDWRKQFDERQLKEIKYCRIYADDFRHGTDGHNIRLIVARMAELLDGAE